MPDVVAGKCYACVQEGPSAYAGAKPKFDKCPAGKMCDLNKAKNSPVANPKPKVLTTGCVDDPCDGKFSPLSKTQCQSCNYNNPGPGNLTIDRRAGSDCLVCPQFDFDVTSPMLNLPSVLMSPVMECIHAGSSVPPLKSPPYAGCTTVSGNPGALCADDDPYIYGTQPLCCGTALTECGLETVGKAPSTVNVPNCCAKGVTTDSCGP